MRQFIQVLRQIDNFLGRPLEIVTAATIFVQMVVMFAGVIFRYFLNNSLTWSDELSAYLLVLVTFLGAYVALRAGMLIRIELFINLFPVKHKKPLIVLGNCSIIAFLGSIVYFSIVLITSPVVMMQVTAAMELPMYLFYSIIPIGCALMLLQFVIRTYDVLQEKPDMEAGKKREVESWS